MKAVSEKRGPYSLVKFGYNCKKMTEKRQLFDRQQTV